MYKICLSNNYCCSISLACKLKDCYPINSVILRSISTITLLTDEAAIFTFNICIINYFNYKISRPTTDYL